MSARLFVVGCPRSGTTLVQSLLAAHSSAISFTESHFFDRGYAWRPWGWVRTREAETRLATFVEDNGLDFVSSRFPDETRLADLGTQFIAMLDCAAGARGSRLWIEKTPDHVFRIPVIRQYAPDALFVHVVRRPSGVLPSLYLASRQWGRPKSWLNCALHWWAAVMTSARYLGRSGHAHVMYERIAEDPATSLRHLVQWVGLPWEAEALTRQAAVAAQVSRSDETWKARALGHQAQPPGVKVSPPSWLRWTLEQTRAFRRVEAHLSAAGR